MAEVASHHMMSHHHVLKTVRKCASTCEEMVSMLLAMPDLSARRMQLRLLEDCADICHLTVKYMARQSAFAKRIANLCASVCESCGHECARFPDAESQRCARICLDCARECRTFAMSY